MQRRYTCFCWLILDIRAFARLLLESIRPHVEIGGTVLDFIGDFEEWDEILMLLIQVKVIESEVPVIHQIPVRKFTDDDGDDDVMDMDVDENGLVDDAEEIDDRKEEQLASETWPELGFLD